MQSFDVSNNMLEGTIPSSLSRMGEELYAFSIGNNPGLIGNCWLNYTTQLLSYCNIEGISWSCQCNAPTTPPCSSTTPCHNSSMGINPMKLNSYAKVRSRSKSTLKSNPWL